MGQGVSKALGQLRRAVDKNAAAVSAQYSDPSAIAGFRRRLDGQDLKQQQFLQQKAGGRPNQEMPPELLKFLNDVGPVRKRDSSKQLGDRAGRESTSTIDASRRKEPMPLAESVTGFETDRTTSFSHKHDVVDPKELSVDVVGLYALLAQHDQYSVSSNVELVSDYYEQLIRGRNAEWTVSEQRSHKELLQNTIKYCSLPVIMKDTDDDFIGTWQHRVEELERMKVSLVSKSSVKLVLEDLREIEHSSKVEREHDDTAPVKRQTTTS